MRKLAATALRFPVSSVFVGSTGVIGRPLPMPVIRQAISPLTRLLSRSGHKPAAQAIMTTDTIHKEVALQAKIGRRMLTIGGMAKGSGMIHPDMATMLAYLTTDAAIAPRALQAALTRVVNDHLQLHLRRRRLEHERYGVVPRQWPGRESDYSDRHSPMGNVLRLVAGGLPVACASNLPGRRRGDQDCRDYRGAERGPIAKRRKSLKPLQRRCW